MNENALKMLQTQRTIQHTYLKTPISWTSITHIHLQKPALPVTTVYRYEILATPTKSHQLEFLKPVYLTKYSEYFNN